VGVLSYSKPHQFNIFLAKNWGFLVFYENYQVLTQVHFFASFSILAEEEKIEVDQNGNVRVERVERWRPLIGAEKTAYEHPGQSERKFVIDIFLTLAATSMVISNIFMWKRKYEFAAIITASVIIASVVATALMGAAGGVVATTLMGGAATGVAIAVSITAAIVGGDVVDVTENIKLYAIFSFIFYMLIIAIVVFS